MHNCGLKILELAEAGSYTGQVKDMWSCEAASCFAVWGGGGGMRSSALHTDFQYKGNSDKIYECTLKLHFV